MASARWICIYCSKSIHGIARALQPKHDAFLLLSSAHIAIWHKLQRQFSTSSIHVNGLIKAWAAFDEHVNMFQEKQSNMHILR